MKLTVQLLTWNGAKYVPYLFDSLRAQAFTDWKLSILDNNSTDNTVEAVKKELESVSATLRRINYQLEVNKENMGFAGGQNQLFKKLDSEYVLFLNQDMFLDKNCLKTMVDFLDKNDCAGVSPQLMKWDFPNGFTDKADSCGLKVYKNRRVVDLAEAKGEEVFGISGAMPMFKRRDLKSILFSDGSLFDEAYGSYKEDVDLAFRLRSAGLKVGVAANALAYHDRASSKEGYQPAHIKYSSYKNHLMTIYKNEYWQNFILDFPWILWYELKKFFWFLLFDRMVLNGLKDIWNGRAKLKNKRNEIKNKRRLSWREMRKKFRNP